MVTLSAILFITNVVFGVIEFLIGMRILLKLFGAGVAAPFVNWVYETSAPLVGPFQGMFPAPKLQGGFVIEFSALFGLLVYAFVAYGISELIKYLEVQAQTVSRVRAEKSEGRGRGRPKKG